MEESDRGKVMKYSELIREVNTILSQYTVKLTLRQVYYRLVSKNLIPNTKASYKGLSHQLVKAREKGDVDDRRIEDRSRKVQGFGDWGFDDLDDFIAGQVSRLKDSWENFSRRQWEDQPKKVIVALEKDALSRMFTDVANGFRIQVYATKGYGSYTFVNDLAGDLDEEKENVILYFGDYDPSGRDIERDLRDRLVRYYGRDNFTVVRIALKPDQISQYNLPPMPEDAETLAKLGRDPRTKQYGMEFAVELDALEPPVLQELIRSSINAQIDSDLWNAKLEETKADREELRERLRAWCVVVDPDKLEEAIEKTLQSSQISSDLDREKLRVALRVFIDYLKKTTGED
ncbi:hypothetical protein MUP59_01435 [Candidatus Bathyarchaeota archaeon]|nr:hypothetical protein [Candidatus Bathyarchaeota archaeon]